MKTTEKLFSPPICSEQHTHTHTHPICRLNTCIQRWHSSHTHRHSGAVTLSVPWCLVSRALQSVSTSLTNTATNQGPAYKHTLLFTLYTHPAWLPVQTSCSDSWTTRLLHKVTAIRLSKLQHAWTFCPITRLKDKYIRYSSVILVPRIRLVKRSILNALVLGCYCFYSDGSYTGIRT